MSIENNTATASIIPMDDPKPEVELSGSDGNALSIMSVCKRAARRAGWTPDQRTALQKEMLSGDYDHVLDTAERFFETC